MIVGIGCQGRSLSSFVEALTQHRIDTVVDIRRFDDDAQLVFTTMSLQLSLTFYGIDYVALPELSGSTRYTDSDGRIVCHNPDAGLWRDSYREALMLAVERNLDPVAAGYRFLGELALAERVAVLCYERDQHECIREQLIGQVAEQYRL